MPRDLRELAKAVARGQADLPTVDLLGLQVPDFINQGMPYYLQARILDIILEAQGDGGVRATRSYELAMRILAEVLAYSPDPASRLDLATLLKLPLQGDEWKAIEGYVLALITRALPKAEEQGPVDEVGEGNSPPGPVPTS